MIKYSVVLGPVFPNVHVTDESKLLAVRQFEGKTG